MKPLGYFHSDERQLANNKPVLTSVDRAGLAHTRALDESTAFLKSVEEKQRRKFCRERSSVRFWVDSSMEKIVEGVEGLLLPCVVEPPVIAEVKHSSPRQVEKIKDLDKRGNGNNMCFLSLQSDVKPKSSKAGNCSGRSGKKCQIMEEKPFQHSPKTIRDVMGSMPHGFPQPFEESGFECLTHWADVSFHEVLLTALGPRSERQRRGNDKQNNRLLVSVTCYLLNELLTRNSGLSSLWLQMRDIIFGAIFAPPSFQQGQKNFVEEKSSGLSFAERQDYKNLQLWSDELLKSLKENARLSDRIEEMQSVVRKKRLVLRFAQRYVDKMCLKYAFAAWRKTTQQRRAFCEAAMKYVTRMRHRMNVEGCFLRWRRVAACSHVSELTRMLRESEIRVAFLETSSSKTVASITNQLEEERKAVKILRLEQEALKSQLAESHVLALRAISNELRQHQLNVIAAKTESKRWERLAKTFAMKGLCPVVSLGLKKNGFSLRLMEENFAMSESHSPELFVKARNCLESFLLEWVNFVMKNSPGGIFWCRTVKINTGLNDGDFGPSSLQRLVRVLESLYVKKGMQRSVRVSSPLARDIGTDSIGTEGKQTLASNKVTDTLFAELVDLMYMQTTEGLFPPLLSHCHFADTFFTADLFCRVSHPSAMLWVLASLFVGYTRLICGEPVVAKNDIDSIMRCRKEKLVGNRIFGFVHNERPPNLKEQREGKAALVGSSPQKKKLKKPNSSCIVANDTVVKKKRFSSVWRKNFSSKYDRIYRNSLEERSAPSSAAERLADTISDLEVYLGINKSDDEYTSSTSSEGFFNDYEDDFSNDELPESSATHIAETDSGLGAGKENTIDADRLRRVERKARALPPIDNSLCSFSMHEFVTFNHQELARRRTWLGLSRIVTSLVVRFRILDVESLYAPNRRISLALKTKKGHSLVSRCSSPAVSLFSGSISKPQRRLVQLLSSCNTDKNSCTTGDFTNEGQVTLRSILEKSV